MVKRGRPNKDKVMRDRVFFRIDRDDAKKLETLVKDSGKNKSEVVREALKLLYEERKKGDERR